jgi:hypothetical protein
VARQLTQSTQSLTQQTGLAQEADVKAIQDAIANLSNQQNLDVGNVNTAIANLQSGGGQSALSNAVALLNQQQASQAPTKGEVVTMGGGKYLVDPYTGSKTYLGPAESDGGDSFSSLVARILDLRDREQQPTTQQPAQQQDEYEIVNPKGGEQSRTDIPLWMQQTPQLQSKTNTSSSVVKPFWMK